MSREPQVVDGCIVGLGPSGIGAALAVARAAGGIRIACLEAGLSATQRSCSILDHRGCRFASPCHIIGGVGGSSLLSGGKISRFPAGRGLIGPGGSGEAVEALLQRAYGYLAQLVPFQAPDIPDARIAEAVSAYGKLGFEFRYYDAFTYRQPDLVAAYTQLLTEVEQRGEVSLETSVHRISPEPGGFRVDARRDGIEVSWKARWVILAVGRLGKSLISSMEPHGLATSPGRCDVGVRLEFPAKCWPDVDRFHKDLKLHFGNARTFCVCSSGMLAPYRVDDIFLVEGHALSGSQTGFTNLAITIRQQDFASADGASLFSAVRLGTLQESRGMPIRQSLQDFLGDRESTTRARRDGASISYWRWGNANACFPPVVAAQIRSAVAYFADRVLPPAAVAETSVFAPEVDYYWPACLVGTGFESTAPGLFVVGDATGKFRGILQSFASGLACADHVVRTTHSSGEFGAQ